MEKRVSVLQIFLISGLLVAELSGSRVMAEVEPSPNPELPCPAQNFVKSELYFGLSRTGGGRVTEAEWQQFLNQVVTPRFRGGLSVVNVYGQYLARSGELVVESSKLLTLVYRSRAEKEKAIAEIITLYKQKFAQESVLRMSTCVQASF